MSETNRILSEGKKISFVSKKSMQRYEGYFIGSIIADNEIIHIEMVHGKYFFTKLIILYVEIVFN